MRDLMFMSKKENVILKMLKKRLAEHGVTSVFAKLDMDDIIFNWDEAGIVVLYLDEPIDSLDEEFTALQASNLEDARKFILIGGDNEKEHIAEYLSDNDIIARYPMPIDTSAFIDRTCQMLGKSVNGAKTILIVDDDAALMSTMRGWLKDDYNIQLTNTGMHALKWLKDNIPNLIILDYEMPLMSGPEFMEKLKQDFRLKNIPVIFMTGKTDEDSVMKVMSLKPVGYLVKPVEQKKMLKTLSDFFAEN